MIKPFLKSLFRLLFRVRVEGQGPATQGGKLLVIANHESFLDGLLLGLFLPFRATFVVHTTVLPDKQQGRFHSFLLHLPHRSDNIIGALSLHEL